MNDYTLFHYQVVGADFLAGRRFALLADEPGVGKSAQAIRACDLLDARRILVLCPAVARINWAREFHRFSLFGLPAHVLFARTDRAPTGDGIVIASYDYLTDTKAKDYLCASQWDALICDEAHFLKSLDAQRTKTVLGRSGLIHSSQRTWLLSGTPMTNHPGDLWPMLFVSNTTSLSAEAFTEKFCTGRRTPFGHKVTGANHQAVPELKTMLAKVMLRRRKTDVLKDLPPITYSSVTVEPGPVDLEITLYDLWRRAGGDEKLRKVIDTQEQTLAAAMTALTFSKTPLRDLLPIMTGMEKSLSELRQYTGLAKVPALVELISSELEAGAYEKLVIFACHKSVIESLRDGLRKYKAVTLYGGTPPMKRQENIDKFRTNPKCRVFIGNIQACGTAISLTSAHNALFVECDWTPANNAQAAMRIHRIGQDKPVRIRYASLANSTDERVMDALRRKTRDELAIFGN